MTTWAIPEMRKKEINAIVEALREVWQAHPDLRLGQLISNTAKKVNVDVFYMLDDQVYNFMDPDL